ncbi:MAG TPA: hypothetical protein VFO17_03230 [Acidimicrobiia bacterium]|jgi:hypothetical protein|nr:hypothetical protein [Acidimicrobiia bacterium]
MTTASYERRIGGSEDVSEVYERFGKADLVASLVGMFAGLGVLVFLGALLAAGADSIDFQLNLINEEGGLDEASILGLVVAAVVVFISFLVGGYAAGRMARYSGGLNGLGAGLWLILLVAVFAALGAWVGAEYNAFSQLDLPNWFSQIDTDELTTMAVVATVVMVAATLAGGYIGGRIGETYHTRVDAALIDAARKEA